MAKKKFFFKIFFFKNFFGIGVYPMVTINLFLYFIVKKTGARCVCPDKLNIFKNQSVKKIGIIFFYSNQGRIFFFAEYSVEISEFLAIYFHNYWIQFM